MMFGFMIQTHVNREDYELASMKDTTLFVKKNYQTPQSSAIDSKDSGKLA